MSQSIFSSGKNVNEAIKHGLNALGIDKEDASIEIIQREKKGFFRIGSKPAVVKLTKQRYNNQLERTSEENIHEFEELRKSLDGENEVQLEMMEGPKNFFSEIQEKVNLEQVEGKVWVKGGKLFCKSSRLRYPTISVGKGVKCYKNGEQITGTTVVAKEDEFRFETEAEEKETQWNITLDSQKLNAILAVSPGMTKKYMIRDCEPDFHIEIQAEEVIKIKNDLEYTKILEKLKSLKVAYGINHSEIMRAVNTETPGRFIIASGIKPEEGKNGWLELVVDVEKKAGPKERADGTVDFREVKFIPTVKKGQVIAVVHPPTNGKPGFTVTNEPLPAKQTFPLIVQAGKGIALIENGSKIVATEMGRPLIEYRGLIVKASIIPKHVHHGDVNISSGNIRFRGDIDIIGNVEDGMVVEGDGIINVFQNVNRASVSSKSSIKIYRNCIGSTLSAGKQNIFEAELVHLLSSIHDYTSKIILSIQQLMNLPAIKKTDYQKRGFQPLIKVLMEQKFGAIESPIKQFLEICNKGNRLLDLEWLTMAEQLRQTFLSSAANEFHSLQQMGQLKKRLEQMMEKHSQPMEQNCFIELSYALNSTIYSSGDVIIYGQGCYHSKIHAGGTLIIKGILRGGEVYAKNGAKIKEAGSEGSASTKIIVPPDKSISIDIVKEGTEIQIGKVKYTFQRELKGISARLDNDKIIF
ncbi:hypothetical protein PB1_06097 [Bacillus methanolicus PB1]|uniref:RNA-binding protein KhpB N-terminal domain-containing protein n=1 Tax=Bacillus methanolicus PB1 TaxID=997296 RepID=I3E092_BACMT|nr:flagellar assembly protein A [Bacillus methanolicus]EIJ79913.1 hypothetical protein PB1_06097 [Bacillus methanolicus PB1]